MSSARVILLILATVMFVLTSLDIRPQRVNPLGVGLLLATLAFIVS
jgi:hypothetical protein